jgi:acetyl-CoA acetyltransferase
MSVLPGAAAIAGIGATEFSKESGRSELRLACEAVLAAITDAGLQPSDVDGMVTFTQDTNDELAVARSVGVPELRWTARTPGGGAGASATVQLAAAAVEAGMADAVVIYRAFNERSGRRFGQPLPTAPPSMSWTLPYGLDTPAKMYSLWFQRYMHRYGVTNEDLGRYTVVARKHAATNPAAWFYERPITLEDHQASRWIVEPIIRKLDCCQESDGGVAIVVTSLDRARDLRQEPVVVEAASQSHLVDGDVMFNYHHADIADFPEARSLGEQLWRVAGIGPSDIDVAMIYENFSPVVLLQLEAFGFCGRGEAKDFIKNGNIELGGDLPINTHGGQLGEAYLHGMNGIAEAVRQVRGTSVNQIPRVENVIVTGGTGVPTSGLIVSADH